MPAVRARLQERYRFLLIDELQDTDPVQMELVESLCGAGLTAGKLFAVGDANQSIYRFRGADVHCFQQLRDRMPHEGRQDLTENFRSQPAILDFANALLRASVSTDYEPLETDNPQVNPGPCVEFLWSPREGDGDRTAGKASVTEGRVAEADWIARRIAALVHGRAEIVVDRDGDARRLRPVRAGDVVLLFRAMSNVHLYEAALRRHGLDYYLVGGRAFFAQQEIYDLLNLLRALENPQDGVSLAGVLRSPFCCLSDEALFVLAGRPRRDGLWAGLCDEAAEARLPADQREPVRRARRHLQRWRGLKDRLPIARLLGAVFADSGYDAATQLEYLGDRKLANLWKLQDLARTFDRSGLFGLAEFIARLGDFVRTPAARGTGGDAAGERRRGAPDDHSPGEGAGVSRGDRAGPGGDGPRRRPAGRPVGPRPRLRGPAAGRGRGSRLSRFRLEIVAGAVRPGGVAGGSAHALRGLHAGAGLPRSCRRRCRTGISRPAPGCRRWPDASIWRRAAASRRTWRSNGGRPCWCMTVRARRRPRRPPRRWSATPPAPPPLRDGRAAAFVDVAAAPPPGVVSADDLAGRAGPSPGERILRSVMEGWDFREPDAWRPLLERFAGNTDGNQDLEEILNRFSGSEMRDRLAAAATCLHEAEYFLNLTRAGVVADETPLVRGRIDCLWRDADGRWRLLFFTLAPAADREQVWRERLTGMVLAAAAVREQTGKWPAGVALHFLRDDCTIERAPGRLSPGRILAAAAAELRSLAIGNSAG